MKSYCPIFALKNGGLVYNCGLMTKCNLIPWGVAVIFAFHANIIAQTISPTNLVVNNASSAQFTVSAPGATSYQWQLNGAPLSDTGANTYNPGSVSGAATSALSLENVTSNEAGTYTVLVNGSPNGASAVLAVTNGTILNLTFSGIPTNSPSNMMVQLFDHDKPATVQNFIHYVRSGAWSNMFMQRCVPGFIIQGGSYDTLDRTNTVTPITGEDVDSAFAFAPNQNPPFPYKIASEFYHGPHIKNDFGTLAFALYGSFFVPTDPNSGRDGFFFNLADNSGAPYLLDTTTNGPFTVFGRVIGTGTNVLNYFNTLTNTNAFGSGGGMVSGTQFSNILVSNITTGFVALPVGYNGTNLAANSNLVYVDFSPTNLASDTNPPTVTVNLANTFFTNSPAVQGTASDDVGLADIICTLTPQNNNGGLANLGQSVTNIASGTTNWAVTNYDIDLDTQNYYDNNGYILPGTYLMSVQSQDGAGNLSAPATNRITVTSVMTNGNGTVSFLNAGLTSYNPVGYPFQDDGTVYDLLATPGSNSVFLNWSGEGSTNIFKEIATQIGDGQLLMATFISNNAAGTLALTAPTANALLPAGPFTIAGTISNGLTPPVTVTCSIFSSNGGNLVVPPIIVAATNNWSFTETNPLYSGSYILQAVATDASGHTSLATNVFTMSSVVVVGQGTVSLTQNGTNVTSNPFGYALTAGENYTLTATPAAGQSFLNWTYGNFVTASPSISFGYQGGFWTATFIASNVPHGTKDIVSFTYPSNGQKLRTNSFTMKGKIASSVKSAQIRFNIFSVSSGTEADSGLAVSATNTWSVPVTNLPPDTYLVQAIATNTNGWSQVVSEAFYVLDFVHATGTYTGLFLCTNGPVTATNSGFVSVTVGASGSFTGKIQFPGYRTVSFNGGRDAFFANGTFGFTYNAFPSNPISAAMSLDLSGSGILAGNVASQNGSWSSQLICYRGATKLSADTVPAKGKYVADLFMGSQTNYPETNGYASINAAAGGTLSVAGALPDGATFSESAHVSTNGIWPLYVTPSGYAENGMLMGWETNTATNFSGQLYWYKKAGVGVYFTNGVNTNMTTAGTNYPAAEPVAGTYSIVFQGGSLTIPVTNSLTVVHAGGPFNPGNSSANPDRLSISLSSSGVLSGHFVHPETQKTVQFKGAYFGGTNGGSGFILEGSGQTGSFLLKQQ